MNRRRDIEALRVLACAGVMLLHATLIHGPEPLYHLKSGVDSRVAGLIAEALRITTMPLFFLLAGWSAVGALRRRDAARFLRERVRRLLVPLAAGIVLLCPFIKYIELSAGRDLRPAGFRLITPLMDPLWLFLPRFFTRVALATWSHLWFLAYLFVISLALLPLLSCLARRVPDQRVPAFGWLLLPGVALAILLAAAQGYWPYYPTLYRDWGNVAYYGTCFALGGAIAAWPGMEVRLRTAWPVLLGLGGLAFAAVALLGETAGGRLAVGMTAWCIAIGALGWAAQCRFGPWVERLGPAAMPAYVLHHLILLLLALVILPTGWPWVIQAAIGWVGTMVLSLLAWKVLILPWRFTRLLAGAQALPSPTSQSAPHRT